MNELTAKEYRSAEEDFKIGFGMCMPTLSAEAKKNVQHYLNHGELEMAFESLGLSVKAEGIHVPRAARELLYPLGAGLGLIEESVFSATFWKEVSPLLKP